MLKNNTKGIIALTLTALFYSLMAIPTRLLPNVNSFFLVWTAFVITAIITTCIAYRQNKNYLLDILKNNYKFATGLAIMHVLSSVTLNLAVKLTDLSIAGLLLYSAPIWVFAFSLLTKKIKLNFKNVLLVSLGIISILLILGFENLHLSKFDLGAILGLLAGFFYSFDFLWGEKLQKDYSGIELTSFVHIIGSIILAPALWLNTNLNTYSYNDWLFIILFGSLLVLSFVLFMYGVKRVKAFYSSIITLLEPVFLTLIGFLLYNETPEKNVLVGGVLILFCIGLINTNE